MQEFDFIELAQIHTVEYYQFREVNIKWHFNLTR